MYIRALGASSISDFIISILVAANKGKLLGLKTKSLLREVLDISTFKCVENHLNEWAALFKFKISLEKPYGIESSSNNFLNK